MYTQEYWVGDPKSEYTLDKFTVTNSYACETDDANYKYSGAPDFIEFIDTTLSW